MTAISFLRGRRGALRVPANRRFAGAPALPAAALLIASLGAGCGASPGRRTAVGPGPEPRSPAAAENQTAPLPGPLLRLPMVLQEGPRTLTLAWDAAPGATSLWLHWRAGRGPEGGLRVAGRAVGLRRAQPSRGGSRRRFRARLTELPAGAEVSYRLCARKGCAPKEAIYANRIPPAKKGALSLLVLGGIGQGGKKQRAVARLARSIWTRRPIGEAPSGAEMTVFLGDLFPPGASAPQKDAYFYRMYEDVMASGPTYAVPGPEDLSPDCGASFRRRFAQPERYRSLKRGEALFLFLDSNRADDYAPLAQKAPRGACAQRCPANPKSGRPRCAGSDLRLADQGQIAWMARTLVRDTSRWRIVFMHHPLFSGGVRNGYGSSAGRRSAEGLQRRLFRLFRAHRVDLVFASGDPIYERSLQVVEPDLGRGSFHVLGGGVEQGRLVFEKGGGPVFVVTGGAGAPARTSRMPVRIPLLERALKVDRADTSNPWVGAAAVRPHLVHVRIERDRLVLGAWEPEGRLLDQIEIRKPKKER